MSDKRGQDGNFPESMEGGKQLNAGVKRRQGIRSPQADRGDSENGYSESRKDASPIGLQTGQGDSELKYGWRENVMPTGSPETRQKHHVATAKAECLQQETKSGDASLIILKVEHNVRCRIDYANQMGSPYPSLPKSSTAMGGLNKSRPQESSLALPVIIFGVVITLGLFVCAVAYQSVCKHVNMSLPMCDEEEPIDMEMQERFKLLLKALKAQFPSQPRRSWGTIGSSIITIFKTEPQRPSVLLLIATNDTKETCRCLMEWMGKIIAETFQEPVPKEAISSTELSRNSRYDLDMKLRDDLGAGHLALVDEIDKLPKAAALLLQAYCNEEDAPFRKAVLIFSASSTSSVSLERIGEDELAEDVLNEAWSEIDVDKRSAVISRVAVNVVVVREESTNACD